jgi:hypothetical protein
MLESEETAETDSEPAEPSFRATILDGRLFLTEWAAWLTGHNPLGIRDEPSATQAAAIADLSPLGVGEDELLVMLREEGPDREDALRTLLGWAGRVGYRRVWLESELIEIPPSPEQIGPAAVRCPVCRSEWHASSPEFWIAVRKAKRFPPWCARCGCELPQWDVDEGSRPPRGYILGVM